MLIVTASTGALNISLRLPLLYLLSLYDSGMQMISSLHMLMTKLMTKTPSRQLDAIRKCTELSLHLKSGILALSRYIRCVWFMCNVFTLCIFGEQVWRRSC